MKTISIFTFITLLLSILVMSSKSYGHDKSSVLEGPYVGQNPPGPVPFGGRWT